MGGCGPPNRFQKRDPHSNFVLELEALLRRHSITKGGSAMRVCVFVDGENLRHSIVDLFETFDQREYLPKSAQWGNLFDSFVEAATDAKGERLRTYWYVVDDVDPVPWRVPDSTGSAQELKRLAWGNDLLKRQLAISSETDLETKLELAHSWLKRSCDGIKRRFAGFRTVQDGIQRKHRSIEFRRSGTISFDLGNGTFGDEKTVDVNLGVDMVLFRDIYDVAVIISGDQDYVPAVQAVKDSGKHVVNVAFLARNGTLLPGGARRLNVVTDWSVEYDYERLRKLLGVAARS
jgi:hypothetical protein